MSKRKQNRTVGKQLSRWQQTVNGLVLASALAVAPSVMAEDNAGASAKRHYQIGSGSLSHALSQFAGSAGILLSVNARLTDGKSSPGLQGEYSVEEGLRKLLSGTGLVHTYTGDNTVTLKVVENRSQTDAATLAAVRVTGKAVYDPDDPYNTDYNRSNASTATKTDTPIMETPMNIQVVPKSLMNDQQDINITDAITKNVSGVQARYDSGTIYEAFILRGFTTNDIYRNGLLRGFGTYDPSNIEQIEVIKGPASMLYGRAQPGGLINYVTKKGLDSPAYSVQQQVGSYDQYRTTADATGPIDKDGKLRYRLNFAYQDIGSFKQFVNDERYFVAPTLSWRPNDRFEANLELEHKHEKKATDYGIPSIGNRPAPVPLDRSYQDSAKGPVLDTTLVAYDWAFKFNDDWKVKNRFLWENWDIDYYDTGNKKLLADNQTLTRNLVTGPANQETYATNLDLTGKFNLLGSKHDVLFGGDYYHNAYAAPNNRYTTTAVLPPINIFNPVYNVVSQAAVNALPYSWNYIRKEERFGAYFQDQITLFDKLHILGGGATIGSLMAQVVIARPLTWQRLTTATRKTRNSVRA
ncbi:TonB-dependent siderophore receptor [Methylomonas methanica]|uniref:TonB-dependent siderophore receptor n=1 Tax=Methylomonas methanica TaxID=421 RepID=UPI0002E3D0D8|nr:TonB-dependent receptor [Methylomonas methanica]